MKKGSLLAVIIVMALVLLSACSSATATTSTSSSEATPSSDTTIPNEETSTPATTDAETERVLVLYYSRTGTTETLANAIYGIVGGDLLQIETVDPYDATFEETVALVEQQQAEGYKPPLETEIRDLEQYDVIFLGSPIWYGNISLPIETFLTEYSVSGKTIVPFVTHNGGGPETSWETLKSYCPDATVLAGYDLMAEDGVNEDEIKQWLTEVGVGVG